MYRYLIDNGRKGQAPLCLCFVIIFGCLPLFLLVSSLAEMLRRPKFVVAATALCVDTSISCPQIPSPCHAVREPLTPTSVGNSARRQFSSTSPFHQYFTGKSIPRVLYDTLHGMVYGKNYHRKKKEEWKENIKKKNQEKVDLITWNTWTTKRASFEEEPATGAAGLGGGSGKGVPYFGDGPRKKPASLGENNPFDPKHSIRR